MEHRLAEAKKEGLVRFHFVEFDDGMDFIAIVRIIKTIIKPDKIDYRGIEDSNGYFEKDGLHIDLEYDGLIGNWMEFKGEQTKENLAKVRGWAELIFNELMAGVKA
jgi:hypothetical protein